MDDKLLFINIAWLFFIVTLPFSTNVLSTHFGSTASIFLYSLNIFMLSICQNFIWDYADAIGFVDRGSISSFSHSRFRIMLNLDMLNGFVAIIISFLYPKAAFFILFFKIPIFIFMIFYTGYRRRLLGSDVNNELSAETEE